MATTYGMTTPIISPVIPNPTTATNTVSSMGVQGLPMSSALPIIVNESTPNLAEIQSFPVVVRNGGIHIHQDPVTGQRYRMTDEFHSRIPQILAGNSSVIGMTGGVMPVSIPYVTTEYSLQSQFEDPIIFTDSNSLVSQLREYIVKVETDRDRVLSDVTERSIQNEYNSLYADYNTSLKTFQTKVYYGGTNTLSRPLASVIGYKNRYSYPTFSYTSISRNNIQPMISLVSRYSYPKV